MLRIFIPEECRNRYIFLLLPLIAITLLSCSKPTNNKKGITVKDGAFYDSITNKPYSGNITDTVSNQIMSYEVVNGIKDGQFMVKGLDGKTLMEGMLKKNKNEGKWKYYYPTGKLESEGNFVNDTVEGKWSWYYEDGTIKEEGYFENGKREGVWILYDINGNVKSIMNFKNGAKISEDKSKGFFTEFRKYS